MIVLKGIITICPFGVAIALPVDEAAIVDLR